MIVLGLTGSIGMGKSTTARLFAEAGAAVYDADAAVHALYGPGGAAVGPVEAAFPGVVVDGAVDRTRLAARVVGDPPAMARLEALVHPLLAAARDGFHARALASGAKVAVLDVPLLFETGGDRQVDAVVVVSAPESVQRARVLERPGITPETLDALLARQLADAEKRGRADYVIDTGAGLEPVRAEVARILAEVTAPDWVPPRDRRAAT